MKLISTILTSETVTHYTLTKESFYDLSYPTSLRIRFLKQDVKDLKKI